MDAKITKERLGHMLSYDFLKIIAVCVGAIFIWMSVFTMTATRILPSQQFGICNFLGTSTTQKFSEYINLTDKFSYEIMETRSQDLSTGGEEYVYQLMEARLATREIDVMFAADIEGSSYQYQNQVGGEILKATYLEELLYRYRNNVYRLDGENGFLKNMENFLNGYYNGDYTKGDLDEEKIENDFRAFVASTKDKRFKTEAAVSAGVQNEIKRVKGYKTNLLDFYSYLDAGYISLTQKTLYYNINNKIEELTGAFSINVCPDEKMESLKQNVYYRVKDEESGATKTSALNINIVLFSAPQTRESFEFESLAFINSLVETHCLDLQEK
ncbi:MAG: hypothetical protein IKA72_00245 [Clostridia bacterium]|nr:hypothetical protein [Clostridia bacterium]